MMSAAVTTPFLLGVELEDLLAGLGDLHDQLLMFRMMSVTSSTTPGMVDELVLRRP